MYDNCGEIENFSTCGEISDVATWQMWRNLKISTWHVCDIENVAIYANFCHKLCAFMWRKIEPKSTFVEKKWQISGLCNWEQICESTYRVQVPAYNVHLRLEEPVSPGRRLDARALVHQCSVQCAVCIVQCALSLEWHFYCTTIRLAATQLWLPQVS